MLLLFLTRPFHTQLLRPCLTPCSLQSERRAADAAHEALVNELRQEIAAVRAEGHTVTAELESAFHRRRRAGD